MALNCVEEDSQERPDIVKIIDALNEIERNISKVIHINGDLFLNKNPL